MQAFVEAAIELIEVIAEENDALRAVQYAAAGRLGDRKRSAIEQFISARDVAEAGPEGVDAFFLAAMAAGLERLHEVAEDNRRLLDRAITVQGRVISYIVRAIPEAAAAARCYGETGAPTTGGHVTPLAMLSRV